MSNVTESVLNPKWSPSTFGGPLSRRSSYPSVPNDTLPTPTDPTTFSSLADPGGPHTWMEAKALERTTLQAPDALKIGDRRGGRTGAIRREDRRPEDGWLRMGSKEERGRRGGRPGGLERRPEVLRLASDLAPAVHDVVLVGHAWPSEHGPRQGRPRSQTFCWPMSENVVLAH
eukprot:3223828-Rhodomonas_salina.2